MDLTAKAIGGYFGLELPKSKAEPYSDALKFQSARAAFYGLLMAGKPKRVWMPRYICNSMLSPLYSANIEVIFYGLTEQLGVDDSVAIVKGDWLLYVNYFGICVGQQQALLHRFDSNQLIFDHSQAFYISPFECLATIYSPRKFFGVPDGGLLLADLAVEVPLEKDINSGSRCQHLLHRIDQQPESGYYLYKEAEHSLEDTKPLQMSGLTRKLLASIDYENVRLKRNANFLFLHQKLSKFNELTIDLNLVNGPMCYPLLISDLRIRQRLLTQRIFVATYWPEVSEREGVNPLELRLMMTCLPIPCDQRYKEADLFRICEVLEP